MWDKSSRSNGTGGSWVGAAATGRTVANRVQRVRCVGAIVGDRAGRLLLVRRAHPPGAGLWSLPGGRAREGESDEQALVREVREETGLTVRVDSLVGTVQRAGPPGTVFDIRDYAATLAAGTLRAADDARDARWVTYEDFASLPLTEGLGEALAAWRVLPARHRGADGDPSPGAGDPGDWRAG